MQEERFLTHLCADNCLGKRLQSRLAISTISTISLISMLAFFALNSGTVPGIAPPRSQGGSVLRLVYRGGAERVAEKGIVRGEKHPRRGQSPIHSIGFIGAVDK